MGILSRFFRICRADIHGVMDLLEDRDLLLKQHLRDMETALEADQTRLNRMKQAREQALRDHEACRGECEKLDEDLAAAIAKSNDPVARLIIRRLKPKEDCRDELARQIGQLDEDIRGLTEQLERRLTELRQIRIRARAYLREAARKRPDTEAVSAADTGTDADMSDEEIECELFRRKQNLEKGASS